MEKIASRVEKKEYVQRTTGTRPTRAETMNTTTTGERTIAATFQSLSILRIEMEKSAQLPGGWGGGAMRQIIRDNTNIGLAGDPGPVYS